MRNLNYVVLISSNVELNDFSVNKVEALNGFQPNPDGIHIEYNESRRKFRVTLSEEYMDKNNIPMIFLSKHAISKVKEYIEENNLNG